MCNTRYWKPHTRIKLRFYKHYLQICANHHQQDDYQRFTLVDLYCGDSHLSFKDGAKEHGSPLIALKKNLKSVFNDINPDIYENIKKLQYDFPNQILEVFNSDANEDIDKILEYVTSYYHSLFYIDPDNASQLTFDTVQKVINHTNTYQNGYLRRHEILLNYPILSIVKNCGFIERNNSRCAINSKFYGNDKWKSAFLLGKTPVERRENLFSAYLDNFKPYYKHSYSVLVESLARNTALYYVVFFSNYDKIDEILPGLINNINIWKSQDFIRKYKYNIGLPIDYYAKEESQKVIDREFKKNFDDKKQISLVKFLQEECKNI